MLAIVPLFTCTCTIVDKLPTVRVHESNVTIGLSALYYNCIYHTYLYLLVCRQRVPVAIIIKLCLQEVKSERYRLKFIVDELRNKDNPLEYKTTLLAFVNCLIISTPQLKDRVRVRNEFIGKMSNIRMYRYTSTYVIYTIEYCIIRTLYTHRSIFDFIRRQKKKQKKNNELLPRFLFYASTCRIEGLSPITTSSIATKRKENRNNVS